MGNSGALLCTGRAALELSGLKSRDGEPGSAVLDCAPWRTVLGSERRTESSPRGWVIQSSVSQSVLGWMNWHITTTLNFFFLLSAVCGHVPGALGPLLGGMTWDRWLTITVQLQPGTAGTKCCLHLGRPTFERSSAGRCSSSSAQVPHFIFAVINRGFGNWTALALLEEDPSSNEEL